MVDRLIGSWKLQKSENFEAYLDANNVNIHLAQVFCKATIYEEISRRGDRWSIYMTSTFRSSRLEFNLDEPFTENTLDGRILKSTFSIEGNKLVCVQEPIKEGDLSSRVTREVTEEGRMLLTFLSIPKNVVSKRYFEACIL